MSVTVFFTKPALIHISNIINILENGEYIYLVRKNCEVNVYKRSEVDYIKIE